jgi:hypothetical protein
MAHQESGDRAEDVQNDDNYDDDGEGTFQVVVCRGLSGIVAGPTAK